MRAVAIQEDRSLAVTELDEPRPAAGEVRVRVEACGICGSDLHMRPSPLIPAGLVMGHEFAGTVDAVGEGVGGWVQGDRACVYPFRPMDAHDPEVAMATGVGMGAAPGGYAEAVCVPADMLWRLPEEVPLEHGALVEPLAVALHSLEVGDAAAEDRCAVIGAGPIGVMHALALRARGTRAVVVIEKNPDRRRRAAELGFATADADGAQDALPAELGGPPSLVLECAGHPSALPLALELLAPSGRAVVAGMLEEPVPIPQFILMLKEARLLGSFAYRPRDFDAAVELLARRAVPAEALITGRAPLERAQEMFDELARPETDHLKVLLRP